MTAGYWENVEALFHRACTLPSTQWPQKLREWSGGDEALTAEVLTLLEADSEVEALRGPGGAADGADPWIGRQLGHFTIDRLLGRGGMGAVYLARRDTAEMSQIVAIKIAARHLRSPLLLQQFAAERDALGRMEHRHVARLIDGGIEGDAPYVVMEYVEGQRLDDYCDDPTVTLQTRLRLFLELCAAVSYVHGHLILHRDLKPGNVLVTRDGLAKLVDFGAFRNLDGAAAGSLLTRAGIRTVTLNYASPEHIRGDPQSTASDVYSLGVILYRLLAGHVPHDIADRGLGAFLTELQREVARRPTAGLAAPVALRADLDAIVAKAMRFDPAQRYATAESLAADLRSALESRPVGARVGTLRHRTAKFVLRHRPALLSLTAIILTLVAGMLAIAYAGRNARVEAARALTGVEIERNLTHLLLFDYFEQLKQIPGSTDAQRRALLQAVAYLDSVQQAVPASFWLADRVAAYTRMGNLLGNPYEENVNDAPQAITTLEKAVGLADTLVRARPTDRQALQLAADAQQALGRVYFGTGDPLHAVKYLATAAVISERIAAAPGRDSALLAQAASVSDSVGDVYDQEGAVTLEDPQAAATAYRRAQDLDIRGLALDAGCARCRRGIALEDWKLGMLAEARDVPRALALYRSGLETLARFPEAERTSARVLRIDTVIRQRLGAGLLAAGSSQQGKAMLEEVHARFAAAVRNDPLDARARFDLAALDPTLADAYEALHDTAAARTVVLEYLASMNFLIAQDASSNIWRYHHADALLRYARDLAATGPTAQSRQIQSQALHELVQLAAAPGANASVLLALARAQRETGLSAESRATAQRVLVMTAQHPGAPDNRELREQAQALAADAAH